MPLTMNGGGQTTHPLAYHLARNGAGRVPLREPDSTYLAPRPRPPAWSDASFRLFAHFERPVQDRPPTAYRRELVDSYAPNETYLLPRELAHQLFRAAQWTQGRPRGAFARAVQEPFVVDLAWSSSALEGNTLSRQQTEALFSLGPLLRGEGAEHDEDVQMLINHKSAIDHLVNAAPAQALCVELVLAVHERLMERLVARPDDLGRIRQHPLRIQGSTFAPAQDPALLQEMLERILAKASAVRNPVEAAFFLWIHIAYLQAFVDGNKRTSRLMANVPLLLQNCAPLSFEGIDEYHYGVAVASVYECNDVSAAIDLFAHTYRRSMRKYVALLAVRPRADPLAWRYREPLLRVLTAVVVHRRSAAAAIAHEGLTPAETVEFGALVVDRLRTLLPDGDARHGIDDARVDAWIAAGRPH